MWAATKAFASKYGLWILGGVGGLWAVGKMAEGRGESQEVMQYPQAFFMPGTPSTFLGEQALGGDIVAGGGGGGELSDETILALGQAHQATASQAITAQQRIAEAEAAAMKLEAENAVKMGLSQQKYDYDLALAQMAFQQEMLMASQSVSASAANREGQTMILGNYSGKASDYTPTPAQQALINNPPPVPKTQSIPTVSTPTPTPSPKSTSLTVGSLSNLEPRQYLDAKTAESLAAVGDYAGVYNIASSGGYSAADVAGALGVTVEDVNRVTDELGKPRL